MPITLYEPTRNRVFGPYARLLIDIDLSKPICDNVLVEREGFPFHVGVVYEKHLEYCHSYQTLGHHISQCNKLKREKIVASNKKDKPKGEKNPKFVVAPLTSSIENAEIEDTNMYSLATSAHVVDYIPDVRLDGNAVLPQSPSDQGKIDNNHDETSDTNSSIIYQI
ncbi:hypothetical protein MTR_2g038110 [Medicago truncatula]|uniref:Zinc knuckle CX2CX4HX4C domain-containing protein n=2 Tax=Medicago truncatula TaxID=3880 RepID=G7IG98_MEDTR|nr:hypothetical protein MTR_2g038110 [Medicago truncatula]